ncbi:hypothetical protein [Sphingobacterium sp.]|jgi:hypothetical protein|uniref:hypothetical protein n=1 Tax=Sphingobacterium sp. TaxID=341027 RepID=UPI002899DFCA|nr:hypothetical protein [Sphingobacterium sp.]
MKNRFIKKLKKANGLPLTMYFLERDSLDLNQDLLKMVEVPRINSKGYRVINYYKPISKL